MDGESHEELFWDNVIESVFTCNRDEISSRDETRSKMKKNSVYTRVLFWDETSRISSQDEI